MLYSYLENYAFPVNCEGREGEEYVSIIHILSRCDEEIVDRIISTKESVDIISGLSETPIAPVVYKVEELLNDSLKDDINEK